MSIPALLATTAAISVSGALCPGPVTAVTISHGTRDRHAGALVAIHLTGAPSAGGRSSLAAGLVLSATNPYFYLWWLSVGMVLVLQASSLGPVAFLLFIVAHWACDVVWLWVLSALAFKGGYVFGERFQTGAFVVCGVALAGFGVEFVVDAVAIFGG